MMGTRSRGAFEGAVHRMDAATFRSFVNWIWETRGFETTVHGRSSRAAIDITATRTDGHGQTLGVRAIHRGRDRPVEAEDIEYLAARDHPDAVDRLVVVTAGQFTGAARKLAAYHDIRLYDGDGLADLAPPNVVAGLDGADDVREVDATTRSSARSDGKRLRRDRTPAVDVGVEGPEAISAEAPVLVGAAAGALLYSGLALFGVVTTGIDPVVVVVALFGAAVVGRNLAPDDPRHPPILAGLLAMLMLGSILVPLHIVFLGIPPQWAFLAGGVVYTTFVLATRAHPEFQ